MGLTRAIREQKINLTRATTLSERTAENLQQQAEAFDRPVYQLRPYKGDAGVEEAVNLLDGLYRFETKWIRYNVSETHAFEQWFGANDRVSYRYIPERVKTGEEFREQANEDYQNTRITQSFQTVPEEMFEPDRALAGARFSFFRDPIYPIRHLENGGFGTSNRGSVRDPYKDLIGPFTRDEDCQLIFQVLFSPMKRGFIRKRLARRQVRDLKSENTVWLHEEPATKIEKEAAKTIEEELTKQIFGVEARLLVSAPTENRAVERLKDFVDRIRGRYSTNLNQGIYGEPASSIVPGLRGRKIANLASTVVNRERDGFGVMECSPEQLAGLAHLPSDDLNNQYIDWTATKAGDPVPVGTPRVPWEEYGLDPMELSPHEEQEVMMTRPEKGDPYWLGRGSRKAIEAGIDPDLLKLHMFVGGSTGYGKTTTLKNLFRQFMGRGHGGLFYDPKADDARDFVSLVPEGREDDLIYVEVGGDREQQVGFNFLEIPGNPDPDSQRFAEAIESLADDIEALLSQAGGKDDYWGPRMSRVVRNMARGMAKSGRDLTLLDMYYALIDERGRQEYAQHLSDERIEWIVDYASRQLADMDDSDIEPLIGRLQQWVESDLMRSIVSHPESTFSVEEAVANGKIIIVRDNTDTGGTAGTMIATALIRRIWAAVQKRQDDDRFEDPPMFYAILDEFDKIVSEQAATANILSLARAYNLSMIPACQDLMNQLGDQPKIRNAILGQCNTFLNFNPRRKGEAKEMITRHSEDVTASDLTNLPRYQFYMRTEDNRGDPTYSYKVDAFPPVDDVIEDMARGEDETEALIERSLDEYAAERMTSEEIREEAEFRSGGDPAGAVSAEDVGATEEDTQERDLLLAAVDRAHIRAEAVGEFVHPDRVTDAWRTLAGSDELGYQSQTANLVEEVPDDYLEKDRRGGDVYVRLTPEGREAAGLLQDTGSSGSGGGAEHRWVLSESKLAFERMGYCVSLPTQEGESLPDGVALLPVDPTEADDLEEIHERERELKAEFNAVYEFSGGRDVSIEAETSTITKPIRTMINLRKAMDANMKCVFTTKDGSYDEESAHADEVDHKSLFEYWARRGERIMYATNDCEDLIFARERDEADNRWFYNKSKQFVIDERTEKVALRPADENTETVWRDDGDDIVLASRHRNGHEAVQATFSGPKDLADPPAEDFPAYYQHNPEGDGNFHVQEGGEQYVFQSKAELEAEWTPVVEPFIPGIEFTDEHGEPDIPTE